MDPIDSFNSILKELQDLPPPGVSGSRIKKLTDIALKDFNKENESKFITSLYSNCKSINSQNKLGILYVIDSIVRKYKDEADKVEMEISNNSEEGTFASAVYKIGELIESLVDDALELSINPSTNLKISKLIDIWDRYQTFPSDVIKNIKNKHFKSFTPPGTPPKTSVEPIKPKSNDDSNSILASLASLAQKSSTPPTAQSEINSLPPQPPQQQPQQNVETNSILSQLSALAGNNNNNGNNNNTADSNNQQVYSQASPPAANNEQLILNMLQQMQGQNAVPQNVSQVAHENDYRSPRDSSFNRRERSRSPKRNHTSAPAPSIQGMQQNLQHLKQLKAQQQQQQQQQQPPVPQMNTQFPIQNSPPVQNQAPFNQPQPMGGEMNLPGTPHYRPRNVGFDASCPQGSIKVLSRTLFLGGVPRNMDERSLAQVLRPFAEIQSVILNSERKHAFVKVYSRREAEQVITNFNKDNSSPLRTRWGVGFGPRDCCNYQHGVSIIPLQRLTDADKTWVVNAQWGGSGGQPISTGMVIDEPDIEISGGLGPGSKSMSRKMPTNSSRNGPKSNRPGEPDDDYVKTSLSSQMNHGGQPDFNMYQQSGGIPLQGFPQIPQIPQQQQQQLPNSLPPNITEILMQAMQNQQQHQQR